MFPQNQVWTANCNRQLPYQHGIIVCFAYPFGQLFVEQNHTMKGSTVLCKFLKMFWPLWITWTYLHYYDPYHYSIPNINSSVHYSLTIHIALPTSNEIFNTYQSIIKIVVFIKHWIVPCRSIKVDPTWAKCRHKTCEHQLTSKVQQTWMWKQ